MGKYVSHTSINKSLQRVLQLFVEHFARVHEEMDLGFFYSKREFRLRYLVGPVDSRWALKLNNKYLSLT